MSNPPSSQPPDPNVIHPSQARDPILILIISLFLGGISYFVLGQWQKGLAALALWLAGIVFAILTCGIGVLFFFPIAVAIVIDVYMQAKTLKDGRPIGQWTFFGGYAG